MAPKVKWDEWAVPLPEVAEVLRFAEHRPGLRDLGADPWHVEVAVRSSWLRNDGDRQGGPEYYITEAGRRALRRYERGSAA